MSNSTFSSILDARPSTSRVLIQDTIDILNATSSFMNTFKHSIFPTTIEPEVIFNEQPPVEDWCYDLIVYYRSIAEDDEQSLKVLLQLETYSKFSFVVNGIITCLLASFGLLGNILFVSQLYKSRYFSRRLASHLAFLCVWDMALLLCCLLTYGIMASYYGIIPFVGVVAYLLYFFQPFASFCVTGTIWQVLAISYERYTAVSRPLEQRTRNAQFSLKTICAFIAAGAFLLNMVVVPFERRLTECYEFTQNGFQIRTMIVQQEIVNNRFYAIPHLLPDIIFRAPTPIILIAILTVRTLQICARRTVGTQIIQQTTRNIPYMLTILNFKFIMCNTLYMFNTILMEVMGYGGKTSSQQTELEMEQYIRSLYLTDFSNMLLAVHSATNWLIFYHWPKFGKQKHKKFSSTLNSTNANPLQIPFLNEETAQLLAQRFKTDKYKIAAEILATLCVDSTQMTHLLTDELTTPAMLKTRVVGANKNGYFLQNLKIQKRSIELGDILEQLVSGLAEKPVSISEWRDLCRTIGYRYSAIHLHVSPEQWKLVRDVLVYSVIVNTQTKLKVPNSRHSKLPIAITKAFNYALREMKSGALCAIVDASHQHTKAFRSSFSSAKANNNNMNNLKSRLSCDGATMMSRFDSWCLPSNNAILQRDGQTQVVLTEKNKHMARRPPRRTSLAADPNACLIRMCEPAPLRPLPCLFESALTQPT